MLQGIGGRGSYPQEARVQRVNDLFLELSTSNYGIRKISNKFESFAYADDVNLFSTIVREGLQKMIDKCLIYSNNWKFKFGIKKIKCIMWACNIKCEPKMSVQQIKCIYETK